MRCRQGPPVQILNASPVSLFCLLGQTYFIGTHFQMLVKHGSSCTWTRSSTGSAGPRGNRGPMSPARSGLSPLFQEIPFAGCTAHTAFCRDAHTDTHAGTARGPRGKNTLVIKPRSWKLKRVRPESNCSELEWIASFHQVTGGPSQAGSKFLLKRRLSFLDWAWHSWETMALFK